MWEAIGRRTTFALFFVSLFAAGLHGLHLLPKGAPEYWSFLSIVAPAAGAAVSGYTGNREYVRQRLRADRMVHRLSQGCTSLMRASTMAELRRAAEAVDFLMLDEAADWFQVTRLHELELP